MKNRIIFSVLATLLVLVSCGEEKERFNYALIKSRLDLTEEQLSQFDNVTGTYGSKAREAYESNMTEREAARKAVAVVFAEQDAEMKKVLTEPQYEIYAAEIKIEREGREKHNMKLIKEELALDSAQSVQFDMANEAFYTTLFDNHDNYHGKPDVYRQYYQELDKSRREAFSMLLSEGQYENYLRMAGEYEIGKSEH